MVARRAEEMTSFIVMDVLDRANEMERDGVDIIHLEVGEPDFDTPDCVKVAACKAINDGYTHYTHSLGMMELREAICEYYDETYGVSVSPHRVMVTQGTSPAIFSVFSAMLEKGDEVIISDPGYACYPNFIQFVGGVAVRVPVTEADGFQYRVSEIEKRMTDRTQAIFLNSPSNPTGNLLSTDRMARIAKLGPAIVSDEIYHGLVYEGEEHTMLEFTDDAFILNGFSKLYAMTGMRLGYVIAPEAYMRPLQKIQQNFFISVNASAQMGGIAALKEGKADTLRMKEIYNTRRIYMIARLKAMGLGITVPPTGAFYVFANVKHISMDSYKLAFDILEHAHVGVTPGIDFGENAEGYLRFSYANSIENIERAMDRLEVYLGTLAARGVGE